MKMKTLKIRWHGTHSLLMHDCKGVNPTLPLVIEKKKLTAKRKKTEEDLLKILDLDYMLALYYEDNIGPYVPALNVEATIRESAKKVKKGQQTKVGIMVKPDYIPLKYDGPRDIESLIKNEKFRDVRPVVVNRSKVLCCRPRFDSCEIEFNLEYDSEVFDIEELANIIRIAGGQIGLCDYRPRYGRFEAFIEEI